MKPLCAWSYWKSPASRMWSLSARRGPLSFYVYGISPNVSPGLLQNVQDSLNDKAAYPLTGLAVAPDLVGISLSTTVEFKAGTSAEEKSLALSAAASAAEDYVNNLRVGETLVLNQIADRLPERRTQDPGGGIKHPIPTKFPIGPY